jgi:multidrug resistance efflux pump
MARSRRLLIIPIILIIIIAIILIATFHNRTNGKDIISASGSIEAIEVEISPQVAGQIVKLLVDEGDSVQKDQVVAEIAHSKLDIQLRQAQANLSAAETRYEQAKMLATLTGTQIKTQVQQAKSMVEIASSRLSQAQIGFDLQGTATSTQIDQAESAIAMASTRLEQAKELYELQQAQSKNQIEQSESALKLATSRLTIAQKGARDQEIKVVENLMAQGKSNFDTAKLNFDRMQKLFGEGAISKQQLELAQLQYDVSQAQYNSAQQQLSLVKEGVRSEDKDAIQSQVDQANSLLQLARSAQIQNNIRGNDIESARSMVKQAESTLSLAKANALQGNLRKEDITASQAGVQQAKSALELAEAGSIQSKIQDQNVLLAETQVNAARDVVELLQSQINDATVKSPISGTITDRAIEVGELVSPGMTVFVIADLNKVYLTIYVSEVMLGKVKLGQLADVSVDSFPNRAFKGKVTYISPEAEFTPKNIQTKDDRLKLVYGVKIEIENPDKALKSGMPADAVLRF